VVCGDRFDYGDCVLGKHLCSPKVVGVIARALYMGPMAPQFKTEGQTFLFLGPVAVDHFLSAIKDVVDRAIRNGCEVS